MEADVSRRKPCSDAALIKLLAELAAKDKQLVGARDFAGNTALEALVLETTQEGAAPIPCWPALLQAFIGGPINGVEMCVAEADDSRLDSFTCSLASCCLQHPFAQDVPRWVGEWAHRAHVLDLSRAVKRSAKRLMQSLVR